MHSKVALVAKLIPDCLCIYLILWGQGLEDAAARLRISHFIDQLRGRSTDVTDVITEEGLLRLNKLISGSTTGFTSLAITCTGVLFALIELVGTTGAIFGIVVFGGALGGQYMMWLGTSIDTLKRALTRQKYLLLAFVAISVALKILAFVFRG